MSELISALLQYTRIIRSENPFEKVDLNTEVQHVLSDLEFAIDESGASVEIAKFPDILGNRIQLRQLFQNLIGNGLKYVAPGVKPAIRVEAKIMNKALEISFVDNGIGIKPEHVERIFQPFKRLHKRNEYKGTGIGLALCKKIVEQHNGTISVKSEYGKGSAFVVQLPLT